MSAINIMNKYHDYPTQLHNENVKHTMNCQLNGKNYYAIYEISQLLHDTAIATFNDH